MVTQENLSNPLETMEEGQDKVPNDKAIQPAGMESTGIGQLPKRNLVLASGKIRQVASG